MALGDDIRKKKRLQKEESEHAAQKKKGAAVSLKGEWLGNVAKDVESSLKSYTDGYYISIHHHVPYDDGITFDESSLRLVSKHCEMLVKRTISALSWSRDRPRKDS